MELLPVPNCLAWGRQNDLFDEGLLLEDEKLYHVSLEAMGIEDKEDDEQEEDEVEDDQDGFEGQDQDEFADDRDEIAGVDFNDDT